MVNNPQNLTEVLDNIAEADALAVEQTLIEMYHLSKDGGQLLNKINSIAPSNPIFGDALARGLELLDYVGYTQN